MAATLTFETLKSKNYQMDYMSAETLISEAPELNPYPMISVSDVIYYYKILMSRLFLTIQALVAKSNGIDVIWR